MKVNGITEGLQLDEAIAVVNALGALNGLSLQCVLAFICGLLDIVCDATKMSNDEVIELIRRTMKREEELDV